ncbi:MAG TPA: NADH:flavin oxidoreductase [Microthrixaceae bacterium]|nr:NADH:flavin oxidoreductase [Actinomycetota bacterium]MBP6729038.1 NADH:flavin oxidoreductase [Microthrixaceae bacterium]HMS12583.1 NADH:flavin oxidoreductase [Microthrixaceae bacterium]
MTEDQVPSPFDKAQLGPIRLRNRFIKSATFEGRSPRRVPTDELIEFHRAMAAGGVAMTTVAYCAVSLEGTTDGRNVVLGHDAEDGLARLADAVHAEGAAVSAQIGHAGPVSDPTRTHKRVLTPSRMISPLGFRPTHACTRGDIAEVTESYARGAECLARAGFDAVEIHLGHNYLLSAFLSPRLNRRRDEYGGSLEHRARFAREVVAAVRSAVGPSVAVLAKLNMADGVGGGLWLDESLRVARWLTEDGHLDALELTGGSSLLNPMYLFRGDAPIREMAAGFPPPFGAGFRLLGSRFLKEYPYEEAYFLPFARQFRAAIDLPLVLLGGVSDLETAHVAMREGFEFVAMGRALLREPDLIRRYEEREASTSLCVHCNKCMPTIYSGTRCVLVEDSK